MPSNQEVRKAVEDVVETEIQKTDTEQKLEYQEYDSILVEVADALFQRLLHEMRPELNDADREFVHQRVGELVQQHLQMPTRFEKPSRFEKFDRVVCKIGGQQGWAPGTIQALCVASGF